MKLTDRHTNSIQKSFPSPNTVVKFIRSRLNSTIFFRHTAVLIFITLLTITHAYGEVKLDVADELIGEKLLKADQILAQDVTQSLSLANAALDLAREKKDISAQVYALIVLGHIMEANKQNTEASNFYDQAVRLEQSSTDVSADHNIMFYLARGLRVDNRLVEAQRYLERGIALEKNGSNLSYLMHAYDLLSTVLGRQKKHMESIASSQASLDLAQVLKSKVFTLRSYRKIAQAYKKMSDFKASITYNKLALDIVKEDGDEKKIAQYLEYLSTDQRALGQYPAALENAKRALAVQRKYENNYRISNLLLNISIIYLKISSHDQSLSHALELLSMHEGTGDLNRIASASNQIGLIYNRLKRYEDAGYYHQRILSLDENQVDARYRASAYRSLSNINFHTKEYETALEYAKKGISLSKEIKDLRGQAAANHTLAKIYHALGYNDKAASEYEQSLKISVEIGDRWSESRAWIYAGSVLIEKNASVAEEKINKGLVLAQFLMATSLERDAYASLKIIEKNRLNFSKALEYSEKVESLSKEIDNKKINDRIAELKLIQKTEEKAQEIERLKQTMQIRDLELGKRTSELEILNNQNTIASLKLKEEKTKLVLFFTLSVIFALTLAFVIMRNRYLGESQKILNDRNIEIEKKNAGLAELNLAKDRFFSIISHDLRTPISSIIALADMVSENYESFTAKEVKQYVLNIQSASDRTYSLLENLLSWAVLQLRNADPLHKLNNAREVCDTVIANLSQSAASKNITIQCSISHSETFFADKNMISTIFRNLIGNAIKFTPHGGQISIYSRKELGKNGEEHISIHVKDTGIGINQAEITDLFSLERLTSHKGTDGETGTGFGLALCKDLAEKNSGTLSVETQMDKGSDFYFTVPRVPAITKD